ncbi:MAG: hypothetical protein AAFR46_01270 [Pseudomonadota bacterium]
MRSAVIIVLGLALAGPASGQEQQAGNDDSTDVEGTFQTIVDQCDDVDALMLRARIRLQLPRTTEEAAATAQEMLEAGFKTCSEGDLEAAKATLSEALAIAEAGVSERFEVEETVAAAEDASAEPAAEETAAEEEEDDRPWWQIW